MKLRDCFWLWGHDPGCHHRVPSYRLPGDNRMDAAAGAAHLGIPNCCRVVFGGSPRAPFDTESAKLAGCRRLLWSIVGDCSSTCNDGGSDDLDEVLRQAERFPNVIGGMLDDFFVPEQNRTRLTLERLREVRNRLHRAPRPLELWLVIYSRMLDMGYDDYLAECDAVSCWFWDSNALAGAETTLRKLIDRTPAQRRLAGCYIYNFGDACPMTAAEIASQLELYRDYLHRGLLHGVMVCSNTVADLGLEAPEYLRQWLERHGNEEI